MLRGFRNALFFKIRNTLKLHRQIASLPFEKREPDLNELNLIDEFEMQPYWGQYSPELCRLNFHYLDAFKVMSDYLIDQLSAPRHSISAIDLGSDNWHYCSSQYYFLQNIAKKLHVSSFKIKGLEIDPYVMYTNFRTKLDYAEYYTRLLDHATYESGRIENLEETFDVVFWFQPFVLKREVLDWRLPLSCFDLDSQIIAAHRAMKKDALMLMIFPDEEEKTLFVEKSSAFLEVIVTQEMSNEFYQFKTKRPMVLLKKKSISVI